MALGFGRAGCGVVSRGGAPPSGLRPATSPCRGGWSGSDQRWSLSHCQL